MGVVGIFVLLVASVAVVAQDARALRRQGDDALLLRKWDEAIDVLSKSILLEKENWLGFQKRASAYAGAGLLAKAIDDLNTVLSLKPDHVKSVIKRAELLVQLGKFHDAAISLNGVSGKEAESVKMQALKLGHLQSNAKHLAEKNDFAAAAKVIDEMISAGGNRDFLALEKCRLGFAAGQYYDVVAEAMAVLKKDQSNTDALLIRAKSFFMLGELDAAVTHLKQCIRIQPDHQQCGDEAKRMLTIQSKRDSANQLFKANRFWESVPAIREAIEASKSVPHYALELNVMLCEAFEKGATTIDQWKEGIVVCTEAIGQPQSPDTMKEFRGNLHQKLGNWNEAIQDFSAVLQAQPNNMRMRQRIQEVQNAKKVAERKDYYKILGIARDANRRQIKTAFRKLALQWHPDKFNTEAERETANKMFQDLNEAYDVLTDEEKKGRYDRGEDVEQPQQQQQWGNPFQGFGGQQFHFKFN